MMVIKKYYTKDGLKQLRRVPGIYLLVHAGEIDYIGRSVSIGNRLTSHHVFDKNYHDEIHVIEIEAGYNSCNQRGVELELIHRYSPPRNINGTIRQTIIQTGKPAHRKIRS
jgi:excinuclease UvrABC nuclease subunit